MASPICNTAHFALRNGTFQNAKRTVSVSQTASFASRFCPKSGVFGLFSAKKRGLSIAHPASQGLQPTQGQQVMRCTPVAAIFAGKAALRSVHAILGSANSAFFNIQPAAMPGGCQHRSAATPPAGAPWRLPPFVRRLHGQRRQAAAVGGGARLARRQRATQAADGQRKTDCHKPPRFCCKLVACRRLE